MFFITDCLFAIVMMVAWELPWWFALAFFIFFGALDGVFLSATLNKVIFYSLTALFSTHRDAHAIEECGFACEGLIIPPTLMFAIHSSDIVKSVHNPTIYR